MVRTVFLWPNDDFCWPAAQDFSPRTAIRVELLVGRATSYCYGHWQVSLAESNLARKERHYSSVPSPAALPSTYKEYRKMRFMVIVKATKNSEAGVMPDEQLLAAMGKYNEELVKAGIMQAGEGLHPSSKGKRVHFAGDKRTVIDGPFAETKELIAGFWLWQCKSMEEAVEWVKRCPNPMPHEESEIEIRQVFEAEDFGAEFTPELREQEERLRAEMAKKQ
jgi:hypothetical protein